MEKRFSLRPIFWHHDDTERHGVFVRCPRSGRAQDIGDCLACPRYSGLHLDADGPYRLKCADPVSSWVQQWDAGAA
jgi:hypothetical protein